MRSMLYRDWLNLRSYLLWCYDHRIEENREKGAVHRSDKFINNGAWLVRSGWAEVTYGDQVTRAEPGQWLIVRPGQRIQSFDAGTVLLSVAFEACWPDGSPWLESGLPVVLDRANHPQLEQKAKPLVRTMSEISGRQWDAREHPVSSRQFLRIESLLRVWFLALLDALSDKGIVPTSRSDIDPRLVQAVHLIDALPVGEKMDSALIAKQAGLSFVHLSRLFQQEIGSTPRGYFEKRRIDYAYRHLRLPNARVKEVALSLGFKHLSHFSRWFKESSGQTPRDFKRRS